MGKYYVLYNPLSANNNGKKRAENLKEILNNKELYFYDITQIKDYSKFFEENVKDTNIIICGGDGTINKFINNNEGIESKYNIYYYPTGTGNDFSNDVKDNELNDNGLILINEYLKNLPTVTVNGENYKFLNGIGYGIDGYCCEEGDRLKAKSNKPVNYTSIAIKGLLFHYKPTNAKIYADGKEYNFKKVWIAATMNGRYYGGGMMSAPNQDRLNEEGFVSLVIMHDSGKLKTLSIFPSIFEGEHIKHSDVVKVITGKDIRVQFDRPTALQIDGETFVDIKEYSVKSYKNNTNITEKEFNFI